MFPKVNLISHSPSFRLCILQELFRIITLAGWFNNATQSCFSWLHHYWFGVHLNRLQIRVELDKKPETEINSHNSDLANYCWNYCWPDLSAYNTEVQFPGRQSTRVHRGLLDRKDFIPEYTASSFYSNLFIFFSLGFVFVDKVPSKNKNWSMSIGSTFQRP